MVKDERDPAGNSYNLRMDEIDLSDQENSQGLPDTSSNSDKSAVIEPDAGTGQRRIR